MSVLEMEIRTLRVNSFFAPFLSPLGKVLSAPALCTSPLFPSLEHTPFMLHTHLVEALRAIHHPIILVLLPLA